MFSASINVFCLTFLPLLLLPLVSAQAPLTCNGQGAGPSGAPGFLISTTCTDGAQCPSTICCLQTGSDSLCLGFGFYHECTTNGQCWSNFCLNSECRDPQSAGVSGLQECGSGVGAGPTGAPGFLTIPCSQGSDCGSQICCLQGTGGNLCLGFGFGHTCTSNSECGFSYCSPAGECRDPSGQIAQVGEACELRGSDPKCAEGSSCQTGTCVAATESVTSVSDTESETSTFISDSEDNRNTQTSSLAVTQSQAEPQTVTTVVNGVTTVVVNSPGRVSLTSGASGTTARPTGTGTVTRATGTSTAAANSGALPKTGYVGLEMVGRVALTLVGVFFAL